MCKERRNEVCNRESRCQLTFILSAGLFPGCPFSVSLSPLSLSGVLVSQCRWKERTSVVVLPTQRLNRAAFLVYHSTLALGDHEWNETPGWLEIGAIWCIRPSAIARVVAVSRIREYSLRRVGIWRHWIRRFSVSLRRRAGGGCCVQVGFYVGRFYSGQWYSFPVAAHFDGKCLPSMMENLEWPTIWCLQLSCCFILQKCESRTRLRLKQDISSSLWAATTMYIGACSWCFGGKMRGCWRKCGLDVGETQKVCRAVVELRHKQVPQSCTQCLPWMPHILCPRARWVMLLPSLDVHSTDEFCQTGK